MTEVQMLTWNLNCLLLGPLVCSRFSKVPISLKTCLERLCGWKCSESPPGYLVGSRVQTLFEELRSGQVHPSCQSHKGAAPGQSTALGNLSLVFVMFVAALNFPSEVMNEQPITSVVVKVGQSVSFSFSPKFRKYS